MLLNGALQLNFAMLLYVATLISLYLQLNYAIQPNSAMLILFFDSKGVIHHEYVLEGQTLNTMRYVQVLDRLCKCTARMSPKMWRHRKFFLLHDNACPHTAAIVRQFLV